MTVALDNRNLLRVLDPRTKIAWSVVVSVAVAILGHPLLLGAVFLSTLLPWAIVRPDLRRARLLLAAMAVVFLSTVLSQGLFYGFEPRTPLLCLLPAGTSVLGKLTGGLCLYREGLTYGAVQSLRLLSCLSLGLLIVTTTYPPDLILGLIRLRVPATFAFMLTLALRFLPSLAEEAKRILLAQRLRGLRARGLRGRLRAFRLLLIPLTVNLLRSARQLALAAEVRAFSGQRVPSRELRFSAADWIALAVLTLGLVASIVAAAGGAGAPIAVATR